jgi:hypothetical protein
VFSKTFESWCHRVGNAASIVVRVGVRVRVSGGLKNTRIIEEATVYPGSGRWLPYIQQLMILILKSTKNQEVTVESTGGRERFGKGLARR